MKNILFVIGSGIYPHVVGGMEIFNYYLIKKLSSFFKIHYLSYKRYDYDEGKQLKCFKIKPTKFFAPLQLAFYLLIKPQIQTVVFSYSAAHWILWHLYQKVTRLFNRNYIVVIHYGHTPPVEKKQAYQKFFQQAKAVIAVSNDIKKNYDAYFNINCEVIYPLVPFEQSNLNKKELREKYNLPIKSNIISMIGSLKPMKNPETIIHALCLFTQEEIAKYNPHIVYAGKGESMVKLQELAKQYNLTERISFLGFIPKEKVNDIMKLSNIYLIASDFEGTSVSLLEAMYNELPILASRAPGITNTLNENKDCLMFETKNAQQLKMQLLRLLSNESLSKQLAINAYRNYCNKFSYESIVNSYQRIL